MRKINSMAIFAIMIIVALIPANYAITGTMPLLAVKETDSGFSGSTAMLTLEIKEGTGRVFVDTFPLSKIDTQISMRFAKEVACDFLEMDCDDSDFIYTISANSPIISGPSAGAAASILTISLLSNTPLKEDIAQTGTINSGGLIGPVGGLKEKIEAGAAAGLKAILVPEGETEEIEINESIDDFQNSLNASNSTLKAPLDLKEYGKSLGVSVIEVGNLNSALKIFTGKMFRPENEKIEITPLYEATMKSLAERLCNRTQELKNSVIAVNFSSETKQIYISAANLSIKGESAFENREYYSAASYCFGSNVRYNQVFLREKNFTVKKYIGLIDGLRKEIVDFEDRIDKKEIKTITDLESYMVVKERLAEAKEYANTSKYNSSYDYTYAYANERLISAISWAEFFKNEGKIFDFNEESLKISCQGRIAETEERLQYASLYIPFELTQQRNDLAQSYAYFNSGDYALCLFKASQAKAEANIILNTIGIDASFIPKLIENKLKAAGSVIVKNEKNNVFPILGYSYYEYANNLKDTDKYSALLYSEYSLELSNLDMYFKEKKTALPKQIFDYRLILLLSGVLFGIVIGFLLGRIAIKKAGKKSRAGKKR